MAIGKIIGTQLAKSIASKLLTDYKAKAQQGKLSKDLIPSAAQLLGGLKNLQKAISLDFGKANSATPAILTKVKKAIQSVQQMAIDEGINAGLLKKDGILGKRTLNFLSRSDKCRGENQFKTTTKAVDTGESDLLKIRYWIDQLPTISGTNEKADHLLDDAWISWKRVAEIDARRAGKRTGANVLIQMKPFDGKGGTLADANVGPPNGTVFTLVFDSSETWTADKFEATAAHEIGHLLGLTHASGPGELMSPFRSSIKKPTENDIKNLLSLPSKPWKKRTIHPTNGNDGNDDEINTVLFG